MKDNSSTIAFEQDPAISVQTKKFLTALNSGGGEPLEKMTPADARQVLVGAQASVTFDYSDIDESEKTIAADGFQIKLNIVKPKDAKDGLPVFIFIHGGGWVLGDFPTHKRMVRDLVVNSGTVGVFVNYTPSPEAQYPTAVNEIYAATKWVAENGSEIGVDGTRLSVVGNSVGGNMTAVTAIKSIENNGPKITNLIMLWPIVDAKFDHESYKRFGQDRFLTTPLMEWMYDQYEPNVQKREEIYNSPINASAELLAKFPPTFIPYAEADVLNDGAYAFGRKLDEAGASVVFVEYKGMIHDFGLLNPIADLPEVGVLFRQAAAELRFYLKP
ncbi:alpha/beta hydrolase [Flavobacterium sp.]|uniref:alpha/beta hydrolase n=1 Tax=Flavobacterium sp. TaxID=239 RepID=UPI00121B88BD|nr:alpha/beta hydrolase [Flavobacterium sp.]RZJ69388.1 MAG: alpha/beta hydrolase [Flavobacterium sp.]